MAFRAPSWSFLAILAFGGPTLAIAFVQCRWLQELRARSEVIATHQNHEAALRALDLLLNEMIAARLQVLPAVAHADLLAFHTEPLAGVFATGHARYGYVDRFFVWTRAMAPGEVLFYDPLLGRFAPDPARLALMPELWSWRPEDGKGRWAEYRCPGTASPCQIVNHLVLDDEEEELIAFAGFIVDLERFVRDFLPGFTARRLTPAVREFLEAGETEVSFLDQNGKALVGAASRDRFVSSSVELRVSFALPSDGIRTMTPLRWRLSVSEPNDDRIQGILRRSTLGNLAIVGIGIIALGVGGVLVVRSSVREAKLSDLKSRFISGISHDLKTPLAMIRLYSEMFELGRVPRDKERKLFHFVRQQAEILDDMLEEILDFSRLEAEQGSAPMDLCSLQEIVEEAVEMRDSLSGAPHRVEVKLDREVPPIRCSRSALVRVVYNLLDNATKYSGSLEPITVEIGRNNGLATIEVADAGIGIPPHEVPHLFERFYRGRSSAGVKGAGLGLAIVQSVVKAHGGRVRVTSEPGRGARFRVLLPLVPGRPARESRASSQGREGGS